MDEKKYNIPFEIGRIRDRNLSKLRTKKLILNEIIPTTRQDYYLKSISDCREFLINNSNALIGESLIAKSYYLLANKKLLKKNIFRIVETYYEYKNCDLCELLTMIILTIKEVVFFYKLEYALLLIDFFKYRTYQTEVIFRKDMIRDIRKIFTDSIKRTELIYDFLKVDSLQSINGNDLSFDEIVHYFKQNKDQIMSLFPIKRLFLFGSFAENMNHSKSDLDFIVIFDERIIGLESLLLKNKLTFYLISELKICVDIVLFQYAIKNLDLQSLNKIITIY